MSAVMDWDGFSGFGGWLAMSLMMVAIWGVPIALVVWLVVRSVRPDQSAGTSQPRSRADETLAERYARGEIDEDEFTHRTEVLHTRPKGT